MNFKICQEIGTCWKAKRMDGLPVSDMFMQVIPVIMTGASLSSSLYFILIWLFDPECCLCNLVIVSLDSIFSKGWAKNAKYAIVSSLYFSLFRIEYLYYFTVWKFTSTYKGSKTQGCSIQWTIICLTLLAKKRINFAAYHVNKLKVEVKKLARSLDLRKA